MATEQAAQPRGAVRQGRRTRGPVERTDVETPVAGEESLSGEVVAARISTLEWVMYGALTLIGAIMRLWDLGSRALHHDESLHATYSWYLWQALTGNANQGYHYDPMMHGPYQFHGNALMYLLFGGPSNTAARLDAAICGTALILLPILLRRQLGRVSALILSGLLAFSPAFLYYSRFTREDIYFALWTFIFFIGFIRWLDARGRENGHRWLYMAAAGFALSWATKESTYFTVIIALGFVAGVFAVAYLYQYLTPAGTGGRQVRGREKSFVEALGSFTRANLVPLLAAFRGTPARAWWIGLGIMAVITMVLYWPIGHFAGAHGWQDGFIPGALKEPTTDAQGKTVYYNTDFLTGGLSYWKLQQDVQRGGQPWYYYFLVIPLYEQVAVVFGAAGLFYYLLRGRGRLSLISGASFLVFAALAIVVGPHLPAPLNHGNVNMALLLIPLMLLTGALLVSRPGALVLNLILWWTILTWALYMYAGEKMPWLTLHLLLPTSVVAALYLGHLFQSVRYSRTWLITAGLLAVTAIVSFRGSVALAYADGANPTEMLVYTQTAQDVPHVADVINRIPAQTVTTGGKGHVWVDNNDTWPWVWYLRNDPTNHGWSAAEGDLVSAAQQRYPVVIVSSEQHDTMARDGKLAQFASYTGYKFKLRWWFPEDGYKAWENTGLGGFMAQALQPSSWGNVINWWATRTPFEPQVFQSWSNVYPFYAYIRTDLARTYVPADSFWSSARQRAGNGHYTAPPLQDDVKNGALVVPVTPSLTVNVATLPVHMQVVRDAAIDTSGHIYLADSLLQHVVTLDRSGRYLRSWGSAGTKPGQFGNQSQGPMGLVVAPNGHIYVSDTWNHRVQEFTANGAFVRLFGRPNPAAGIAADSFYGPRQIAVAPDGNLYVADTGNKRIQVYSSTGTHLFNIGAPGLTNLTALGHFNEPSGVAVDRGGTVYVADYWNRRIQRFTLTGKPLGAYTIDGWVSGDYSEPYLAVDNAGHLFATDAPAMSNTHVNHVLELDAATGKLLRAFGDAKKGPLGFPSGVSIGPDGALYIADAGYTKLLKVQP